MKYLKLLLLISVVSFFACTSEQQSETKPTTNITSTTPIANVNNTAPTTTEPTAAVKPEPVKVELPKPKKNKEEKNIWVEQVKNSPFFSVGCCNEEKNLGQSCCCDQVMEKYKEIRKSDKIDLITQVKTKDPLFMACKANKTYRGIIEAIENEGDETEEDEEFDF